MDGITKVAVVETEVLGVKAYHSKCMECGVTTKRRDEEHTAVKDARKHRCAKEI